MLFQGLRKGLVMTLKTGFEVSDANTLKRAFKVVTLTQINLISEVSAVSRSKDPKTDL